MGASVRYQSRPSTQAATSTIGQPLESTSTPAGVFGQRSRSSGTPSPSESTTTGQPNESTRVPNGVLGQRSWSSGTPSPSESTTSTISSSSKSSPPPKKNERPPMRAQVLVAFLSSSSSSKSNSSTQMMLSRPSTVIPQEGSNASFTNLIPRNTGTRRSVDSRLSPSGFSTVGTSDNCRVAPPTPAPRKNFSRLSLGMV